MKTKLAIPNSSRHPFPMLGGLLMLALSSPTSHAGLTWQSRQLDFIRTVTDEDVKADFEFWNDGPGPVTITDVKTSCGCTTAVLDKKTYAPGEKGSISANFHIGERMGLQEKQVTVSTDSADQPLTQLTIRTYIPEVLRIEPRALQWQVNGTADARSIRLTTGIDQRVNVLGVRSSDARVFAELKPIEPGRSYELNVQVASTRDPLRATLRVETDYPVIKPKIFTITVDIAAPFIPAQPITRAVPEAGPTAQPLPMAPAATAVQPAEASPQQPIPVAVVPRSPRTGDAVRQLQWPQQARSTVPRMPMPVVPVTGPNAAASSQQIGDHAQRATPHSLAVPSGNRLSFPTGSSVVTGAVPPTQAARAVAAPAPAPSASGTPTSTVQSGGPSAAISDGRPGLPPSRTP